MCRAENQQLSDEVRILDLNFADLPGHIRRDGVDRDLYGLAVLSSGRIHAKIGKTRKRESHERDEAGFQVCSPPGIGTPSIYAPSASVKDEVSGLFYRNLRPSSVAGTT
jgi:hypothetical protein